jgi:predicted MFS family arabinose efflux permease
MEDGVVSVIVGAVFIFGAWWGGRLWARFKTIKYLALQIVLLLFIAFYLLSQLVSIPREWHAPIIIGYLVVMWFLALQRGGESRR